MENEEKTGMMEGENPIVKEGENVAEGEPAEIYIKFRSPKYTPRIDVLNFMEDVAFNKYMKNENVYIEKFRDQIVEAFQELHKVVPNEEIEKKMDRIRDANRQMKNQYVDPINLAMGAGQTKREYKAFPTVTDSHKYFIFVRNDIETFEAVPVDNIYEMVLSSRKRPNYSMEPEEEETALEELQNKYSTTNDTNDDDKPKPKPKGKGIKSQMPFRIDEENADDEGSERKGADDESGQDDYDEENVEMDYGEDEDDNVSEKSGDEDDTDDEGCQYQTGNKSSGHSSANSSDMQEEYYDSN